MSKTVRIIGIAGSLRHQSYNRSRTSHERR
jgi:hypothetical protein